MELKYAKAEEYYNKKDYFKAAPLFVELITIYKGTKNVEKIYFYHAYCEYGQGNYVLAAYYFKNLVNTYPKSEYAEECQYMYAYCYYLLSPNSNLDQMYSRKAINDFQLFVNKFPNSDRVEKCNEFIDDLRNKLQRKELNNAKLYYDLNYYKSAKIALNNLLKDYPASSDKEDIYFLSFKSDYLLAENSIISKKKERYESVIKSYHAFINKFPQSAYLKEIENNYTSSVKQLNKIKKNE